MKRSEIREALWKGIPEEQVLKELYEKYDGKVYQEFEMDSLWVDTQMDESSANVRVEQHTHSFYEIIYCIQGRIEYLLDTERYEIRDRDIIIIPPGIIHCPIRHLDREIPYRRYVLWISPLFAEWMRQIEPDIFDFRQAVILRTAGESWEYLEEYFLAGLGESDRRAPGWEVSLVGNTAQLLVQLARAVRKLEPVYKSREQDLLEQVLEYIQKNLCKRISVEETARVFHVSPSTLTHLFPQEMSISFYRCVTQRRLAEAKKQIAQGRSMEEISLMVGFSDYSAFYRAFKSEYGVSPAFYKKKVQSENRKLFVAPMEE